MQRCATITLTDQTKTVNLLNALRGTDANATTAYAYGGADADHALMPDQCQELYLQSDPLNGAAKVFVGDKNLSSVNMGLKLSSGDSFPKRAPCDSINLATIYVGTDTLNSVINVMVEIL